MEKKMTISYDYITEARNQEDQDEGIQLISKDNHNVLTSTSERCPAIILRGCILSIDQILAVRSCEELAK